MLFNTFLKMSVKTDHEIGIICNNAKNLYTDKGFKTPYFIRENIFSKPKIRLI